MTQGVVEVLEVVYVEQDERSARCLGRFGTEPSGELYIESPAVVSPGQRVAEDELLEIGLETMPVGHVEDLNDKMKRPPGIVAHERDAHHRVHN